MTPLVCFVVDALRHVGWSRGVGKQVVSDTSGAATNRMTASTPGPSTLYVSVTKFSAVWAYTPYFPSATASCIILNSVIECCNRGCVAHLVACSCLSRTWLEQAALTGAATPGRLT